MKESIKPNRRQSLLQFRKYESQLQSVGVFEHKVFGKTHDQVSFHLQDMKRIIDRIPIQQGGKLNLNELKKRIQLLNPDADISLLSTVFQGKIEIDAQDIYNLWNGQPINDYDPLVEALTLLLDSHDVLDLNKLNQTMEQLGYQKMDKQDQSILIEYLDIFRDKKIDKKDLMKVFSHILQHSQ